jgi:Xaa-Pro aminopeptidase
MTKPIILTAEYAARRQALLSELGGAVAVVFAGDGHAPLKGRWVPDRNFYYLTGIADEPGAAVLFDPSAEDPKKQITLFLRPVNPEVDRWDGYRDEISTHLKASTGFSHIMRNGSLAAVLTQAARRTKRLACLHAFTTYPAPVSPDLAAFRQVAERVLGVSIDDRTQLLPTLRAGKSEAEIACMEMAIAGTTEGYTNVLKMLAPGMNEADVDAALAAGFRAKGAPEAAYNSIVGGGIRGTVLHYMSNNQELVDGELVVIDAGASYENYASDVTRTFPINGTFTERQAEIYDVVLRSLDAGIAAATAGVTNGHIDRVCRAVIEDAGYGDYFPHGAGHPLGLDVHEAGLDGPLLPGMVITIEPGIYIAAENMGIRIEDDILITESGGINLTGHIPRTREQIEAAMRSGR